MNPLPSEHAKAVLTIKETAEQLGFGITTIYGLFHRGEIRGWRNGRRGGIRIDANSVIEWLERSTNQPVQQEPVLLPAPKAPRRRKQKHEGINLDLLCEVYGIA